MTRAEYERLPKVPEGKMWLQPMQDMADELKKLYSRVELEGLPDPDVDLLFDNLSKKAAESLKDQSNLDMLYYTYWACMEEAEKWDSIGNTPNAAIKTAKDREMRAEAMLRTQVLLGWLIAINKRIEELGGKIEA